MAADARDTDDPVLPPAGVDPRLLEILICPHTRKPLAYDRIRSELVSKSAGLAYTIRGGIPVMLPEEARDLEAPEDAPPDTPKTDDGAGAP
ncbi:Trm112 family protein [Hyphomonas sp.]|uniref:Trm112 family protein n=1 Tax=Hyphomonas sp. TaxID=87 RepID=UPI00391B7D28